MDHNYNVFKLIELIKNKQNEKNTFGFYSIKGANWMAKRKTIIKISNTRLKLVKNRYKKQVNKHRQNVQYAKRKKISLKTNNLTCLMHLTSKSN